MLMLSGLLKVYKPATGVNVWLPSNLLAIKAVTCNGERDRCVNSVCVNFTSSIAFGKSNYAIKSIKPKNMSLESERFSSTATEKKLFLAWWAEVIDQQDSHWVWALAASTSVPMQM